MAEKTEKATPKKLRDARKKGQVAKAQDFPSALTFIVSLVGTLIAAGYLYDTLASYMLNIFKIIREPIDLEVKGGYFFQNALQVIFTASIPIVLAVAFVGVVTNFFVVGPMFSMEAMKFNFKRLNPVEGIKQKFKLRTLVELLKSIAKISGAGIVIYLILMNMLPEIILSVTLPVIGSAMIVKTFLIRVAIQVGILFLLIALFDLFFQRRTFAKEMMMEKFELKQEYKDTEGDPYIKGRRRERFREIAYSEGPGAARRAKTIITNPTHLAIAIGFETELEEGVPKIITMGKNQEAERIIKIAINNHIPIMRNVDLAQELFKKGRIGDYIPRETYQAIAEILKWISTFENPEEINWEIFKP